MKSHKPDQSRTHSLYKPKARTLGLASRAWAKLRAAVLADEPLCRDCREQGIVTPATDVDHIDNDGNNNSRDNLAALCHSCHSKKTAHDIRGYDHNRQHRGCDANGVPLDPQHHWHKPKNHQQPTTGNPPPQSRAQDRETGGIPNG